MVGLSIDLSHPAYLFAPICKGLLINADLIAPDPMFFVGLTDLLQSRVQTFGYWQCRLTDVNRLCQVRVAPNVRKGSVVDLIRIIHDNFAMQVCASLPRRQREDTNTLRW